MSLQRLSFLLFFALWLPCWNTGANAQQLSRESLLDFVNTRYQAYFHYNMCTFKNLAMDTPQGRSNGKEPATMWNPTGLDCEQWAQVCLDSGMTGGWLTTKHHGGFCLWDSQHTDYDVASSSVKTDVVKVFTDTFRRAGLKVGLYYSVLDYHHGVENGQVTREEIEFLKAQITELLTQYGPIDYMNFDGWSTWPTTPDFDDIVYAELFQAVKAAQPNCLIVNHCYESNLAHADIPFADAAGRAYPFHPDYLRPTAASDTLQRGWWWDNSEDYGVRKSVDYILKQLESYNSHNSVYVLNISPTPEGRLPDDAVQRLAEVAKVWNKRPALQEAGTNWGYQYDVRRNLAFLCPATQSSTHGFIRDKRAYPRAEIANDGVTEGNGAMEQTSMTNSEKQPWWQVDLTRDCRIDQITIYNRTDKDSDQLADFQVVILDATGNVVWKQDQKSAPNPSVSMDTGGVHGQRVRISLKGQGSLTLAEVIVEGAETENGIADFEGSDYGDWKATGQAFGTGPAHGRLPGQMQVDGFRGKGLVNSFHGGDDSQGTLSSPPFTVQKDFINFLIGGGQHPGKTCMNLLLDGQLVRTATGPNDRPGGSELLEWASWEVKDLRGKEVTLRIVDNQTGGWGHINVDQIVQSDKRAQSESLNRSREIVLDNKYLLFPIRNNAKPCRMKLTIDGKIAQDFDINLAVGDVDWWAKLEISQFAGKTATVSVDRLPADSQGLGLIETSDSIRHAQPLYDEALRPQLRFSQMRGWNNDPNGMVYYDGEYHFFWQSNPFGPKWANMFWGHAVSRDLVQWEELPVALYPRVMAAGHCFSGSAHVDQHNTGGWQTGDEKVLVAAFTDTARGEALAVSNDRGRSWKYIAENPIIKHEGRDPKLVWYEPGQHWVIAVYDIVEDKRTIAFYTSKDLKHWELGSRIDGFHECPELFELPVDGDANTKRWVLFGADAAYYVGSFDGKTFTPEHPQKLRVHHGDYYASQCFSQVPGGRVIQVGWARIEMPGMPFNQAFSLPTELTLKSTSKGIRLCAEPIQELNSLRAETQTADPQTILPSDPIRIATHGQLLDILIEVTPQDAQEITLQLGESRVSYDVAAERLDGMPLPLVDGTFKFRVVVDRPMFELIGGDGDCYKTARRKDAGQAIDAVQLGAVGGKAKLETLTIYSLKSIWRD